MIDTIEDPEGVLRQKHDRFFRDQQETITEDNRQHFNMLMQKFRDLLTQDKDGVTLTEDERFMVYRWIVGEVLMLGAYACARAHGKLEDALHVVRVEYARGEAHNRNDEGGDVETTYQPAKAVTQS